MASPVNIRPRNPIGGKYGKRDVLSDVAEYQDSSHRHKMNVETRRETEPRKRAGRAYRDFKPSDETWDVRVKRQTWRRGMVPSHTLQISISQEDGHTLIDWAKESGMSLAVFIAYLCHLRRQKMLVIVPDGYALESVYDNLFTHALDKRLAQIEEDVRFHFSKLEDEIREDWLVHRS